MDVFVAAYMDVLAAVPKRSLPSGADDCTDRTRNHPRRSESTTLIARSRFFIGMKSLLSPLQFRCSLLQLCYSCIAQRLGTALPAHAFPCILTDVRTTTV